MATREVLAGLAGNFDMEMEMEMEVELQPNCFFPRKMTMVSRWKKVYSSVLSVKARPVRQTAREWKLSAAAASVSFDGRSMPGAAARAPLPPPPLAGRCGSKRCPSTHRNPSSAVLPVRAKPPVSTPHRVWSPSTSLQSRRLYLQHRFHSSHSVCSSLPLLDFKWMAQPNPQPRWSRSMLTENQSWNANSHLPPGTSNAMLTLRTRRFSSQHIDRARW
jgi:hypothetical protein